MLGNDALVMKQLFANPSHKKALSKVSKKYEIKEESKESHISSSDKSVDSVPRQTRAPNLKKRASKVSSIMGHKP